jgi:hypothetical protein
MDWLINKAPKITQIIRSVKNSHVEILQIFDPNYRGLPQALSHQYKILWTMNIRLVDHTLIKKSDKKDMGVAILSKKTPINKIIYNFTHSYVQKAYPNK